MSFVRPVTAMEALAQAAFLCSDADGILDGKMTGDQRALLCARMQRRASALADWIEHAHGLDSREFEINGFLVAPLLPSDYVGGGPLLTSGVLQ
jgi:hypothetical protein